MRRYDAIFQQIANQVSAEFKPCTLKSIFRALEKTVRDVTRQDLRASDFADKCCWGVLL